MKSNKNYMVDIETWKYINCHLRLQWKSTKKQNYSLEKRNMR